MEILQTIWTALTTENEALINIISIPLSIIEANLILLLFTFIFKIQSSKKSNIIFIFIVAFSSTISRFIIPEPYGNIINLLVLFLSIKFIFNQSIIKTILSIIIPMLIIAIVESFLSTLYFNILDVSFNDSANIAIYRIPFIIIVYIFIYIFYLIFRNLHISINPYDTISNKNKILLLLSFVLGLLVIFMQLYLTTFYIKFLPFYITIISIISLIMYFTISLYSLSRTSQLAITTQDLEQQKLYNKTLGILHDNIRGFKHDFNNIVQSIGGYISSEDMDGLKSYYKDLLSDCQKVNNLNILNPEVINDPAIYSLLTSKYYKAEEFGIKINLEIFLDLTTINMKSYEFTRILGILLDNAIEASKECEEKIINITIRKEFNIPRQILKIENTYLNKDINLDKIREKGYSTKEGNTGLGLWEVNQILKRNNNLNLFTDKNDKFFIQQLEIYGK